jgi:pyruvate dehydrogenase E1 component beta subunit
VLIEENKPFCGVGAQISSLLMEQAFDELDAPVLRLSAIDAPAIYSPKLEAKQLPRPTDIVEKVLRIC